MEGIIKLTYTNGWVIGLEAQSDRYYAFWGRSMPLLKIDNVVDVYNDFELSNKASITIPFVENKNRLFTVMPLEGREDFEVVEKTLKAVLINEQSTY